MRCLFVFLIALISLPAMAQDQLVVERASTMATPSALPTAGVYMIITNNGTQDDRLIGAKSALAEKTALHTMKVDDKGVMSMRPADGFAVPAGKALVLPPFGDHIMLMGIKNKFDARQTFPLTLVFEKAGEKTVSVEAVPPEEFIKRFPREVVGDSMARADDAREKLDGKDDKEKSWTQRLRDRIRSLGGETSAPPPPPAELSAPSSEVSAPAMEMPRPPETVPDSAAAPTITNDMTEDEAARAVHDHVMQEHSGHQ